MHLKIEDRLISLSASTANTQNTDVTVHDEVNRAATSNSKILHAVLSRFFTKEINR